MTQRAASDTDKGGVEIPHKHRGEQKLAWAVNDATPTKNVAFVSHFLKPKTRGQPLFNFFKLLKNFYAFTFSM